MKIILAPDSFKGSLSAWALCEHMRAGVLRVFPDAEVVKIPIADGGEGTLENLISASGGRYIEKSVKGPLGEAVAAQYGVLGDGVTAVFETAQASGITLVPTVKRNPLTATSVGTGELIRDALDRGYRKFVVGLGGSAVNDGGTGILSALGVKFFDSAGRELPPGGGALAKLHAIDDSGLDERLAGAEIVAACDVLNPLCGPNGASIVFAPQKGADAEMAAALERAMNHYAEVVLRYKRLDLRSIPGGGAAGGIGSALVGFLGAKMRPGIEVVLEAVEMERHLQDADLLITGEGRLDEQTLSGKVVAGIGKLAAQHGVPVVALCGSHQLAPAQLDELGIAAAMSIVNGPCTLDEALANAPQWAEEQTENMCRLMRLFL